jgi:acetyl-CoA acetyltransferase
MTAYLIAAQQLKFGEYWDQDQLDLAETIVRRIAPDLGVVDGIFMAHAYGGRDIAAALQARLQTDVPVREVRTGGDTAGIAAVRQAADALVLGRGKRFLIVAAEKLTDDDAALQATLNAGLDPAESAAGLTVPALHALAAQSYLRTFGVSEAVFDDISVYHHAAGVANPEAQFPFTVTAEQVRRSPLAAAPLRQLHGAAYADGAAALLIGAEPGPDGIALAGFGEGFAPGSLAARDPLHRLDAVAQAAPGLVDDTVRFAEVYDLFSVSALLAVEALGLAAAGEGTTCFAPGARVRVNAAGGLKAIGHAGAATGLRQVATLFDALKTAAPGTTGIAQMQTAAGDYAAVQVLRKEKS